ncbi:hypothetical protein Tco_1171576, partial [Tanacetum coccineum]
ELLALRGKQRARQLGPDARIPDHQDASGDANSHIYLLPNRTEKLTSTSETSYIIYGNVKSARPKTLDETIELANDLMDQKLRTYATGSPIKRGSNDSSRNNQVGNAEKRGNASGNPDSNVVMGTFLLNNHYASILFNTDADRSFISTTFSSLIDIVPTPLDNSYDVELKMGK